MIEQNTLALHLGVYVLGIALTLLNTSSLADRLRAFASGEANRVRCKIPRRDYCSSNRFAARTLHGIAPRQAFVDLIPPLLVIPARAFRTKPGGICDLKQHRESGNVLAWTAVTTHPHCSKQNW